MKTWQKWSLIIVVGALCAYWVSTNFEWVDVPVPGKMRGEARRDPHYAARLLMERLNQGGRTLKDPALIVQQPEMHTMAALGLFPSIVATRLEPALLEWVKRGGHLVIVVPGIRQTSRFTEAFGLHRLGMHTKKRDPQSPGKWAEATETLHIEGRTLKANIDSCDVFTVDPDLPLIWSATVYGYRPYAQKKKRSWADDDDENDDTKQRKGKSEMVNEEVLALARWQLGAGQVTAMCNDNFLGNGHIGKHDNAELATRVLMRDAPGEVIFISNADYPSLGEWLLDKAWMALIGGALLLLLLIWHRMPRFSAVVPEPSAARPGLREHLLGMARFHLKRRHYQHLLQASREQVLRLAERHSGGRAMEMSEIATLAGVSEQELRTALELVPQHQKTYTEVAAMLAYISDALSRVSLSTDSARKP